MTSSTIFPHSRLILQFLSYQRKQCYYDSWLTFSTRRFVSFTFRLKMKRTCSHMKVGTRAKIFYSVFSSAAYNAKMLAIFLFLGGGAFFGVKGEHVRIPRVEKYFSPSLPVKIGRTYFYKYLTKMMKRDMELPAWYPPRCRMKLDGYIGASILSSLRLWFFFSGTCVYSCESKYEAGCLCVCECLLPTHIYFLA